MTSIRRFVNDLIDRAYYLNKNEYARDHCNYGTCLLVYERRYSSQCVLSSTGGWIRLAIGTCS